MSATEPNSGPPVNEVKAAFLYNFIKFVEWPATAFESTDDTLAICVYGGGRTRAAMESLASKSANDRSLSVTTLTGVEGIATCHVLFIGESSKYRAREILAGAADRGILTVGDRKDFTQLGGAIGFVLVEQRLRFQVNLDAAHAAGLSISSKLLRLAVRVDRSDTSRGR